MNQMSRYSKWTDHSKAWFSQEADPNLGAVRDWCCSEYSTTWEPVDFNIYRSAVPVRIFQIQNWIYQTSPKLIFARSSSPRLDMTHVHATIQVFYNILELLQNEYPGL